MADQKDSRDEAMLEAVNGIVKQAERLTAALSRGDAADALEIARERLLSLQQQAEKDRAT